MSTKVRAMSRGVGSRRESEKAIAAKVASENELRGELFASSNSSSSLRQRRTDERSTMNVTESLIELRQVLHSEVKRSKDTLHTLANSSGRIVETKTEMDTIGSNVEASHKLITKYQRRDLTDKVLIFFGLVLFFGVVLYIVRKRGLGWIF